MKRTFLGRPKIGVLSL